MSENRTELEELADQLHEINRELSQLARPLERLADLDRAQRRQVAAQLRSALARWESLTQQIDQTLEKQNKVS